jgi:hypothetical protein
MIITVPPKEANLLSVEFLRIMVNLNRLSTEKQAQIIGCLVEGNSIRATVRMTGAARNTITKLLADLGEACAESQDGVFQDLPCRVVEADEIWHCRPHLDAGRDRGAAGLSHGP